MMNHAKASHAHSCPLGWETESRGMAGEIVMDTRFLSRQLAHYVWAWCDDCTGDALTWLQRLGCHILSRPEPGQTWMIEGIAGTNAMLCRGQDPIATAQTIGILCGGILWAEAFPDLIMLVNTEWAQRGHKKIA